MVPGKPEWTLVTTFCYWQRPFHDRETLRKKWNSIGADYPGLQASSWCTLISPHPSPPPPAESCTFRPVYAPKDFMGVVMCVSDPNYVPLSLQPEVADSARGSVQASINVESLYRLVSLITYSLMALMGVVSLTEGQKDSQLWLAMLNFFCDHNNYNGASISGEEYDNVYMDTWRSLYPFVPKWGNYFQPYTFTRLTHWHTLICSVWQWLCFVIV